MTRRAAVSLLGFVLALGCTAKPKPEADAKTAAKPEVVEAPAEPEAPPPEPKPAQAETGAPEPKPEEPEPPPPEPTPADDPVRVLLGGERPETVEVLATFEHGRRKLVLYRVDLGQRWLADRPDEDPLLAKIEAAQEACEEENDNVSSMYHCLEQAPAIPGVPPELVPHLAHENGFAWEVAELEFDRAGVGKLLQSKRLLDFGLGAKTDLQDVKFKVYDMDGDKRSELLIVFPLSMPIEDDLESNDVALGFVLDRTDLHVQFATTKLYAYEWSDVSTQSTYIETSWLARDENGDGHNDLVVRERTRESNGGDPDWEDEDEPGSTDSDSSKSVVCMWELAVDRWVCPQWLGTKIIDGGELVEWTRVPLVVDPPPAP